MEIQELLKLYAAHPQVAAADSLLKDNASRNLFFKGLNGSGAAMTIASLFLKERGRCLCILNDLEEAGYFYHAFPTDRLAATILKERMYEAYFHTTSHLAYHVRYGTCRCLFPT